MDPSFKVVCKTVSDPRRAMVSAFCYVPRRDLRDLALFSAAVVVLRLFSRSRRPTASPLMRDTPGQRHVKFSLC